MRTLFLLTTFAFLQGCAYLGDRVVIPEQVNGEVVMARYSEDAYAQKVLSQSKAKCDVDVSDLSDKAQEDYMLLSAAGIAPDLCPEIAKGRNYFDAKAEIATSRHRAISSGLSTVGRVATGAIIADAAVDLGSAIAKNSGDRYNVDVTQTNSNVNTGGASSSNDGLEGLSGGEGLTGAGTGGAAGGVNTSESAPRTNIINVGGNVAVAGERSASGETALVNGDSSVISAVEDSEVKGSDTGEDINKPDDQSSFSDDDGGNGVFDL